jgi:hypothetical protein
MLNLTTTTAKVNVVTSSAATVDTQASWVDMDPSTTPPTFTPDVTNKNISSATTTDVSGSPTGTKRRNVKALNIRNKDGALSVDVTVSHTDGTTSVELKKVTLAPGEVLEYVEGVWSVYDTTGFRKVAQPSDTRLTTKMLAANKTNATTTAAEVTGLTIPVGLGTYYFRYMIVYRSDTTTTGLKWSVNHDGTVTQFVYNAYMVDNNALAATAAGDQDALATTGQILDAWAARAKSNAATMISASVDTINVDMLLVIEGMLTVTVAGNIQLFHASEVATTTTIMAGSSLHLVKVS